jgi:two-component system, cell cycle response regulator DivK
MRNARKTLLIVEDTELDRDLLSQIFEEAYDLQLAADGEAAVELVASKHPDLILMDIGLPGLSGLDAIRAIRAREPDIPIIAVSSRVMPGEKEAALAAGCNDFVAKPIDDLLLVELVRRLLERR